MKRKKLRTINNLLMVFLLCAVMPLLALGREDGISIKQNSSREYHVSKHGNDAHDGSKSLPFATISAAAQKAMPGDVITVHEGIYRERIIPPRGGESDTKRIVYQSAPGEKVVIKGSEIIKGWKKVQNDTWMVTVPNRLFGNFNPYSDLIHGDWFSPKGREHHTGAVYLEGHWLTEAVDLIDVMNPIGEASEWYIKENKQNLLNMAWLQFGNNAKINKRISAANFSTQQGTKTAICSEGGECIGEIEHGDWVQYENVDFGRRTDRIEIRAASVTDGGVIELRLGSPEGKLLGTCLIPNTGGWQSWSTVNTKIKPVSGIQTICLVFKKDVSNLRLWYAKVGESETTIWAQFKGVNPNRSETEINVRQTVFYPEKPGINYLTIQGFTMMHAATPWAPPTAEQIGLIGTHWSQGWIIENCDIRYSTCVGIALGKYGDKWDNTSADTAEGYVKTIERALANGWNKETIGHHIVRNNTISHCEQAGVVGSLGAIFSTITGNTIHDIHVRRLFSGAEMAGIKIHAAIDTTISDNHIYRTERGLWLDWMAQGTRVSRNLFHNNINEDLFVEVNHGPFLVDNNLLLSGVSLKDMSEGGAYLHNLIAGKIASMPEPNRETPYHPSHTTLVAGLTTITGGDDRFYNNIMTGAGQYTDEPNQSAGKDPGWSGGYGLWPYDFRTVPIYTGGNVYYHGAKPYAKEVNPLCQPNFDPDINLVKTGNRLYLQLALSEMPDKAQTPAVTTEQLGKTKVSGLPYINPDGSPLDISIDYFGNRRNEINTIPGPFCNPGTGLFTFQIGEERDNDHKN